MTERTPRNAGNAIAMVFMAIGMAGVVTYGLNNIMRGPAVTAAETSRRTIAENNLIATTRLAIAAAARQGDNKGDCDGDGFVEPLPFREPPVGVAAPTGGGLLPMTLGASLADPWGAQYGYCVWDPGTLNDVATNTACGTTGRLNGARRDDQPAIAVISAGKDGTFQTTCSAFVDTTPADEKPDIPLVDKAPNSDDVVLSYTYAEANGVGGGLWKLRNPNPSSGADYNIAEIGSSTDPMSIRSTSPQGATFEGKLQLQNKGIVLPGDPGDDTITGACTEAKNGQLRRNTSSSPPSIEMCDYTGGNGWAKISGEAAPAEPVCIFGPITSVWGGPGPYSIELSGNFIYGVGRHNDLFGAVTTNPTNPVDETIYGSDGSDFDDSNSLEISGSYAYVPAPGSNRLNVVDISNPSSMTVVGTVVHANLADANDVVISGNYAYVSTGSNGRLNVIDVSTPASPSYVGSVQDSDLNGAGLVLLSGSHVYVQTNNGVAVVDISAPTSPTVVGTYNMTNGAGGIGIKGKYLYAGRWDTAGIDVVDITDPANPTLVTNLSDPLLNETTRFTILGRYLFAAVASYTDSPNAGFAILDIGTPTAPTIVANKNGTTPGGSIVVKGKYAYFQQDYLEVFDIGCDPLVGGGTAPTNPGVPVTAGGVVYLDDPLDAGLVSHWKMTDAPGSRVVKDLVGSNDGEIINEASWIPGQDTSTAISTSIEQDDYILVPGKLGEPQKGTMAGWVNIGNHHIDLGNQDWSTIFNIGNGIDLSDYVADDSGDAWGGLVVYWNSGSWNFLGSTNDMIGATGWHYFTVTWDNDTDIKRIYVDGVIADEVTLAGDIDYGGGSDTYFAAGMNGAVDDIRFYDRALSAAEVAALAKRESTSAINAPSLGGTVVSPMKGRKIAAALEYTCAIKNDGSLWCWGRNSVGQLGTGGTVGNLLPQGLPVQVKEPTSHVYYLTGTNSDLSVGGALFNKTLSPWLETAVSSAGAFTAGQTKTAYGFTPAGHPGVDDGAGVRNYTVIVRPEAALSCITAGVTLARVNSSGTVQTSAPLDVAKPLTSTSIPFTGSVDLGTFASTDRIRVTYTLTETCGGAVSTFSIYGSLEIPLVKHAPWVSVTASSTHACGVKGDGSAWCWGSDFDFSLGNSNFASGYYTEPSRVVDTGAPWVMLAAGQANTCGVQSDGTLWCWGDDTYGQVGNGSGSNSKQSQPVKVGADVDWASVTVGNAFACGIKSSGSMWCWGSDANGQLGNRAVSAANQTSPVLVEEPGPWVKVSAGTEHACAIKTDGTMWCWGRSLLNDLGQTDNADLTGPKKIAVLPNDWIDVSSADDYNCGIKRNGETYCWGDSRYAPYTFGGVTLATSVVTGDNHLCVLKVDGTIGCAGYNTYGQLGNFANATQAYARPVQGFPGPLSWGWNDAATIIMAPYKFNVGLNGGNLTTSVGGIGGFAFTNPGRARIYQTSGDSNQLLIETAGTNTGAQVSFMAAPAAAGDVTSGLVAKWLLDESTGNATSSVGTFPGTVNGGATWDTLRGRNGGALVLDGNDDYVQINRNAALEPSSFTVAFWFRSAGTQTYADANLVNKTINGVAPYLSYLFTLFDGRQLVFQTGHTDGQQHFLYSKTQIIPQKWYYVVGVFDRNSTGQKRLYINGVLDSSANKNVNMSYDTTATGRLLLGGFNSGYRFKGALDDVRLYNRALTVSEATQLYNYQLSIGLTARTMGIDYANDQFEIGRNDATSSLFLNTINPDLAITSAGLVGLGLGATAPATHMDVGGAVRFGSDATCDSNRTGAIRYTGGTPPWSYCNGTAWTSFIGTAGDTWKKTGPTITGSNNTPCVIKSDGYVYCWGEATYGKVGDNQTATPRTKPTKVWDGSTSAGWNDWIMMTGKWETVCGLRSNGTAWCWGNNDYGNFGDNTLVSKSVPTQVKDTAGTGYWADWVAIDTGECQTCGIRSNGSAWCWGEGTIGDGGGVQRITPAQVKDSAGTGYWYDWVSIVNMEDGACGIRSNGEAYCWGACYQGQCGTNTVGAHTYPTKVHDTTTSTGWSDWVKLSANSNDDGTGNTCGIRANGELYCWGRANSGQLGNGTTTPDRLRPTLVSGGYTDWVDVYVGQETTCGLRVTGQLYCWGWNNNASVGDNSQTLRSVPTAVLGAGCTAAYTDWVSVGTGWGRTCGVRANGELYCWGSEYIGQLGNGVNGGPGSVQACPVKVSVN